MGREKDSGVKRGTKRRTRSGSRKYGQPILIEG